MMLSPRNGTYINKSTVFGWEFNTQTSSEQTYEEGHEEDWPAIFKDGLSYNLGKIVDMFGFFEADDEGDEVEEDVVLAGYLPSINQFDQEVLKAMCLSRVNQPMTHPCISDWIRRVLLRQADQMKPKSSLTLGTASIYFLDYLVITSSSSGLLV